MPNGDGKPTIVLNLLATTLKNLFKSKPIKSEPMRWLARLRILEGVPFQYLVPTEDSLPSESIRFFHVDRNWIDTLVDGALSVSLTTTVEREWLIDDEEGETRYDTIISELDDAELLHRPRYNGLFFGAAEGDESSLSSGGQITGMFLRSSLVRDFPGLEISAYHCPDYKGNDPWGRKYSIQTLRMNKLSDTVILLLFNGCPTHVRIQEPSEGIRMGVDGEFGAFELKLKHAEGHLMSGNKKIPVYTRTGGDGTVVDIGEMHKVLWNWVGDEQLDSEFTDQESALVATQMLQYPYQQDFVPMDVMGDQDHPHKDAIWWDGSSGGDAN